ncbi:MAG TPA: hypothetical protein VLE71_03670 [Actinomycetota bacterium]|nr:hypothetical protein [Actinomycetota bacterium]
MSGTRMQLTWRDRLATFVVAAAALVYLVWFMANGADSKTDVRVIAGIVLALGFVASVSAVVPGFDGLIHGSKLYLAVSSLIGLGAFAAGIAALVTGREVWLLLLVVSTVVLWAMSTVRHAAAGTPRSVPPPADAGGLAAPS